MSGLFGGSTPKMPAPTPATPPPSIDQAAQSQQQNDLTRQRKGAAANVLAGGMGASGIPQGPSSNAIKLLGQ